ncbi:MAG: hypothetical protein M3R72_06685 [Bacteroidota bacterium]|nr:hypothetical protein [Bacteroidota bacterium]
MKKMVTLFLSLLGFSALFAQYNNPAENRNYNNGNTTYNGGNYRTNNGNYMPEQGTTMRYNDHNFQRDEHRGDFDRQRAENVRMDGYHRDHDFGYPDRYHDRDDWRRRHHRGLGILGTGLIVGGVIGAVIAVH